MRLTSRHAFIVSTSTKERKMWKIILLASQMSSAVITRISCRKFNKRPLRHAFVYKETNILRCLYIEILLSLYVILLLLCRNFCFVSLISNYRVNKYNELIPEASALMCRIYYCLCSLILLT